MLPDIASPIFGAGPARLTLIGERAYGSHQFKSPFAAFAAWGVGPGLAARRWIDALPIVPRRQDRNRAGKAARGPLQSDSGSFAIAAPHPRGMRTEEPADDAHEIERVDRDRPI